MATKKLARGMGTFFKECEHPESRWSKCPHLYKIRYRNAAGNQSEESGFATQDRAIDRLTEAYKERKSAPRSQAKAERIQKYGFPALLRVELPGQRARPSRTSPTGWDTRVSTSRSRSTGT